MQTKEELEARLCEVSQHYSDLQGQFANLQETPNAEQAQIIVELKQELSSQRNHYENELKNQQAAAEKEAEAKLLHQ